MVNTYCLLCSEGLPVLPLGLPHLSFPWQQSIILTFISKSSENQFLFHTYIQMLISKLIEYDFYLMRSLSLSSFYRNPLKKRMQDKKLQTIQIIPVLSILKFKGPSTCNRFRLKTELFLCGFAFRKRSPGWEFLKTLFSCFRVTVKTELFKNDDVTVLDPAYPRESRAKNKPKCKIAKDTVLQKDPEYPIALSGVIPSRHFRSLTDFIFDRT